MITPIDPISDIAIYQSDDGSVKVHLIVNGETLWINQLGIAELFGVHKSVISRHIDNIFQEGELSQEATVANYATVQKEGLRQVKRAIDFYNLDMIIAVGYRVNSKKATQFRIWANNIIKEYLIKGFAMDDEKLKDPKKAQYFEELLERVRDIRNSERLFYQKITDIFAECSIDYDPNSKITQQFFATVQNKLHWAITQQTAAEIIHNRVNADKSHMGLTTRKNSPTGPIRKSDVVIAKNYLSAEELEGLNRIVTMYLDYAELQAKKHKAMTMGNWVMKLDSFLQFNDMEILQNLGDISHKVAIILAEKEFEKYTEKEMIMYKSDFDEFVQNMKNTKKE